MSVVSAEAFRLLIEGVSDGFFVHDARGRILDVNARSCSDLGYSRTELLARTINDISCGSTPEENFARWAGIPPGTAITIKETAVRKGGSTFPVEVNLNCQIVDGCKLFLGLARDVSEREAARIAMERVNAALEARVEQRTAELRQSEYRIRKERERLLLAVRAGGIGVWDYDLAADTMQCDEQWYGIMGRPSDQPIRSIAEFRAFIHPDDVDRATEVEHTVSHLAVTRQDYGIVFRIVRPDGEIRWIRSVACLVEDALGKPSRAVGFVVDITEARFAEEELSRQAGEDPLTALANRRRFDRKLERVCKQAVRDHRPLALVMIDIDFFKLYNDRYGHVQGDAALKTIARILATAARRPYDLAVRYGGDEFVLLLPESDRPDKVLEEVMARLAQAALPHVASPVCSHVTVSCGCAIVSDPSALAPADLLAEVDKALYCAKEHGRNRIVVVRL